MKKIIFLLIAVFSLSGCSSSKLNKAIKNSEIDKQRSYYEQVKLIGRYNDNFYSEIFYINNIENKNIKYEAKTYDYFKLENKNYRCLANEEGNKICDVTDDDIPFDTNIFLNLIKDTKDVKRVNSKGELRYTYNISKNKFLEATKFLSIDFDLKNDINVSVLIEDNKVSEIVFYLADKNNESMNLTINYLNYSKVKSINLEGYEVNE